MTLYELLVVLKTNARVNITTELESFSIYADSVYALDESVQQMTVKEWSIKGGQTIDVVLETIVSG